MRLVDIECRNSTPGSDHPRGLSPRSELISLRDANMVAAVTASEMLLVIAGIAVVLVFIVLLVMTFGQKK